MKKSMRRRLYDGLVKFVGVSDEERNELRRKIDQSSDEECNVMRSVLETLKLANRAIENAKVRNVLQRKSPSQASVQFLAKYASRDLKACRGLISEAAKKGDELFFIVLGKCLSGEIKKEICDRLDSDIARIVCENPSITAKHAVRELEEWGWSMTEENFRMRKKRLGLVEFIRMNDASLRASRSGRKT
jgi:hypothetical protein